MMNRNPSLPRAPGLNPDLLMKLMPLLLGAQIKDFQLMGEGIWRIGVAFANANTDQNIALSAATGGGLGHIPQLVLPYLYVAPGANPPATQVYVPKFRPSTVTAWTKAQITIQSDTIVTSANAPALFII